jgi:secreted PhoX family phosphatase
MTKKKDELVKARYSPKPKTINGMISNCSNGVKKVKLADIK